MALYAYQAFTKDGKRVSGTVDAASVPSAREQLVKMGLYPITLSLATAEGQAGIMARLNAIFARSVPTKDKILFTKQLAVLLRSGVPLLESFELLIDQFEGRLRGMLITIKDRIREGASLHETLARYPDTFDNIYVQLVRAGEATGKLEVILERLTDYLERTEEVAKRTRAALRDPMIQLGAIGIAVVVLMTQVVPKLAEQFRRAKQELPSSTAFLMALSDFIRNYYLLLGAAIFGAVLLFRYWKSTPSGGRTIDLIKLKVPIIGYFARTSAIIQFSRTLGMLLEGGVNLPEALDIVCKIIDNRILAQALMQARENIIKQGKIAQYLKETKVFPPMAIHLIKTGEESGKLDTMLLTVAQNYESDLNEYADGLSAALAPTMMIIMAVIVGFIVLAIAQPMMQQSSLMGAGLERRTGQMEKGTK
jgi:type II secretory pathway component PulF